MAGIARRGFSRAFWTNTKIAVAGVIVAAIAGAVVYPRGPQIEYESAKISRGNLTVTVSATGTLQPGNMVDVGTEVSGNVELLLVDSNVQVK